MKISAAFMKNTHESIAIPCDDNAKKSVVALNVLMSNKL
jgi:hypothetical protein